jgi:hypothetical protein
VGKRRYRLAERGQVTIGLAAKVGGLRQLPWWR